MFLHKPLGIVGLTGEKIISAFIGGEKSGKQLAKHRHYIILKPEEEIARALQYNGREDYFFALKQEWKTYLHLQKQIDETDKGRVHDKYPQLIVDKKMDR